MRSIPYEDNFFSMIIDMCSTQCNQIIDLPKIMQEYKRVLKPGGAYFAMWRDTDSWITPNQPFTTLFSKQELIDLVSPYFRINLLAYSVFSINADAYIKHHVLEAHKVN